MTFIILQLHFPFVDIQTYQTIYGLPFFFFPNLLSTNFSLFVCLFVCCFFFIGFNVGSVADNRQKYQINREVCYIPGFLMLEKLLPKHIDIPEIYHLVIALLLGHPVSGEL